MSDTENVPGVSQTRPGWRWSKLAIAALLLSPWPAVAIGVVVCWAVPILTQHRTGWDGFGDLLGVVMVGWYALLFGTGWAVTVVWLAVVALWRMRRSGGAVRVRVRGGVLAWVAIVGSVAWAAAAWAAAAALYFGVAAVADAAQKAPPGWP